MSNITNLNSESVAIQGYDPVSYFSEGLLPGMPELTSSYQGATYYFTNFPKSDRQ
jgi:YHS domain-containing protein